MKRWRVKTHVGTFETYAKTRHDAIENIRRRLLAGMPSEWTAKEAK